MYINEITREECEKILKDIYERENEGNILEESKKCIFRMKKRLSHVINEMDKNETGFYYRLNKHILPDQAVYSGVKFFHFQGLSPFGGTEDIVCAIGLIDENKKYPMYVINLYGNRKNILKFNKHFKFEINEDGLKIFGYETILFDNTKKEKEEYYKEQFNIKIKKSDNIETLADYIKDIEDNICKRIKHLKDSYNNFAFGVYICDLDNENKVKERFIIRSEEKYADNFLFSLFRQVPESIPDNDCLNVYSEDIKNLHKGGIITSENEFPISISSVLNSIFYTSAVYISSETLFAYANNLETLNTIVARKIPIGIGKNKIFNIEYNPDWGLDHKRIMLHIKYNNCFTEPRYIVALINTPEAKAYIKENYYTCNDYLEVLGFLKDKIRN